MEFLVYYLFLAIVVYLVNVVPAFMPATWTILALFYIKYDLHLLPVVITGAFMATMGRITLYFISRKLFRPFLGGKIKENYNDLGEILNLDQNLTIPIIFFYAFLPIPSNQVFVAAGLAMADIRVIATSFFLGRLISYTFWVSAANRASDTLEHLFSRYFSKGAGLMSEIFSLVTIIVVGLIPWKKILLWLKNKYKNKIKN